MAILDLKYIHTDYIKHILPFTKNGVFIDTSVMKIFIDGFLEWKFSKKLEKDYQGLSDLFEALKLTNWNKLLITPHILTEICHHFVCDKDRDKRKDYCDMVKIVIPILDEIKEEKEITKENILKLINMDKPVIELGDISIFVAVDDIVNSSCKTAILVNDAGFNNRYENHPNVLIIDYNKTILDLA